MRGLMSSLAAVAMIAGGGWLVLFGRSEPEERDPRQMEAPLSELLVQRRPAPLPVESTVDDDLNQWILRNNEACELLAEGELDEAVELLEECVDAYPDHPMFGSNLARALFRRANHEHDRAGGDRESALEDLRRAVALEPDDRVLSDLLERWERMAAVEEGFAGFDSMRFSLSFDGERDDLIDGWQDVGDVLEQAYGEFWLFFGHDPVLQNDERIRVVLYEREQFREATGLGHWAGGAYDGVLRIMVDDLASQRRAWLRTVRHELAHAFVASLGGQGVPGWLNEGVAQWLEGDGAQAGDRETDLQRARLRLDGHELRPLSELSASFSSLGDAESIGRAYAQSLLLVDLLVRYHGEMLLADLIAASAEGRSVEEEFERELGFELGALLDDLASELSR